MHVIRQQLGEDVQAGQREAQPAATSVKQSQIAIPCP
jgi:hypothetical protein